MRSEVLVSLVVVFALHAAALAPTKRKIACQPPHDTYPFCNTSLSFKERTWDLIGRIHESDYWNLMTARGNPIGNFSELPYLGVPGFNWGLNCVHGIESQCIGNLCATSFPSPPLLGATWNETNVLRMAQIMGVEVRALWLAKAGETGFGDHPIGLDCWSPNINIVRDPRWGRNQETASEDPLKNGRYAVAYTIGMQEGKDPRYLQSVPTLKHWAAYSLDDSDGTVRFRFDAIVSPYDVHDTYLLAFRRGVVEGKATGIMCSYNALNGVPTCGSRFLKEILREKWNFTGYQTSDTGALEDFFPPHHNYSLYRPQGACQALVDGQTDVNSGTVYVNDLPQGVEEGLCSVKDVQQALYDTLSLRFRMGLFDPVEDQPYWNVTLSEVNTARSEEENLHMAEQGMTLLKNEGKLLPIEIPKPVSPTKPFTIAVVGPTGNNSFAMLSNYLGELCPDGTFNCVPTVLDGVVDQMKEYSTSVVVNYAQGCDHRSNDTSGFMEAISVASDADVIIVAVGLNQNIEAEMHDREFINLPGVQGEFVRNISLHASNGGNGSNMIMVLTNGGAVAIEDELPYVGAVLEAWYPGPQGAKAIAKTLFGHHNPGGRLPVTMYKKNFVDEILMSDMSMRNGVGRTYKYYKKDPIFHFGYGLSYGEPLVAGVAPRGPLSPSEETFNATITVSSAPNDSSEHYPKWTTVQFYVLYTNLTANPIGETPTSRLPSKQLAGFKRIRLDSFGTATHTDSISIHKDDVFCTVSDDGVRQVFPGTYTLVATTVDASDNSMENSTVFSVSATTTLADARICPV